MLSLRLDIHPSEFFLFTVIKFSCLILPPIKQKCKTNCKIDFCDNSIVFTNTGAKIWRHIRIRGLFNSSFSSINLQPRIKTCLKVLDLQQQQGHKMLPIGLQIKSSIWFHGRHLSSELVGDSKESCFAWSLRWNQFVKALVYFFEHSSLTQVAESPFFAALEITFV